MMRERKVTTLEDADAGAEDEDEDEGGGGGGGGLAPKRCGDGGTASAITLTRGLRYVVLRWPSGLK